MNKRNAYRLAFGLGAAAALTACAGVVSSPIAAPISANPLFGPSVEVLPAPQLAVIPTARETALTVGKFEAAAMPAARTESAAQAEASTLLDAQEFGCGPGH